MNRPYVLGHRGASAYAPENTLAAFRLAKELGADGVELDVQLSRDGVPVVIHDDTVDRTTSGKGVVTQMTIQELKALRANAEFLIGPFEQERIPTLAEVFEALDGWLHPTGREQPCIINVELKTERITTDGLERATVNLIEKYNLQERVILSSFNPWALHRAKEFNAKLRRGMLYDNSMAFYLRRPWLRFWVKPRAMHPEHGMIDADYMRWAKGKNFGVNTWTVDEAGEARRLAGLGVTSVITNKPDIIVEALEHP